jgi:hypothetical protein
MSLSSLWDRRRGMPIRVPRDGLDSQLWHPGWDNGRVDTPEEARRRVREHKQRGADLIKLMPSGGIASTGEIPARS